MIPRRNHNNVVRGLELEELVEDVVAAGNNNSSRGFEMWNKFFVENPRLDLIGN